MTREEQLKQVVETVLVPLVPFLQAGLPIDWVAPDVQVEVQEGVKS